MSLQECQWSSMAVWSSWVDPRVLSRGLGGPRYIEKSLMWAMLASGHSCGQAGEVKSEREAGSQALMVSTAGKPGYKSLEGQGHGNHTGQPIQRRSLYFRTAKNPRIHPKNARIPAVPTEFYYGPAVGLWYLEMTVLLTVQAQWHYIIPSHLHYFL